MSQEKQNKVTQEILEIINSSNILPWQNPYLIKTLTHNKAKNLVSNKNYQGLNAFILAFKQLNNSYSSNVWCTYKQAQDLGATVKKGEKATYIRLFSQFEKEHKNGDKEGVKFFKSIPVFNLNQTTIVIEQAEPITMPTVDENDFSLAGVLVFEFEKSMGKNIQNAKIVSDNQGQAYYSPSRDLINMPKIEHIKSKSEYYSTLFHEMIHSTGHTSRLNRFDNTRPMAAFGSEEYSLEELVAEFGAAMLCAHVGVTNTVQNSAAYIKNWSDKIKSDTNCFTQAISKASKAYEYLTLNTGVN